MQGNVHDYGRLLFLQADGGEFSETEILDFLRNFLIAGRDTTSILLTFAVYMLSQHPDVEARVLDEIEAVIPDGAITYDKIVQLRYTKAVLQETLRLFPPGTVAAPLIDLLDHDALNGTMMHTTNASSVALSFHLVHYLTVIMRSAD